MTKKHKHEWKRAPEWDTEKSLSHALQAQECFPCRTVRWVHVLADYPPLRKTAER